MNTLLVSRRNSTSSGRHQGGAALLLVLLLVSIISVLAVNSAEQTFILQQQLKRQDQYQSANIERLGAQAFALNHYAEQINSAANSHPRQAWFNTIELSHDGTLLQLQLHPVKSCFNLNSINPPELDTDNQARPVQPSNFQPNKVALQQLQVFLENQQRSQPERDIQAIIAFNQTLSERQKNDPIFAKRRLQQYLLAQDWSVEDWQKVSPWLCYRPISTLHWNINHFQNIDALFLRALLLNEVSEKQALDLINDVQQQALNNNYELWQSDHLAGLKLPAAIKLQLQLKDQFYWLEQSLRKSHHQQLQWLWLEREQQMLKKRLSYRI